MTHTDDPQSLYDILEISSDADERTIKSAFRRMARQHHPDVNPDDPQANERFIEITAAFEILSSPERRELYDEFGLEGLDQNFDPVRARWKKRAEDHAQRDQQRWQQQKEESWSAKFKREYDVNNSSFKSVFEKAFRDFNPFQQDKETKETQDDTPSSDSTSTPPTRGEDVRSKVSISMAHALKGGPVAFEHHDGSMLTINVPAGVDHNEVLLIKAEGLPSPHPQGQPGDLLLTIEVSNPSEAISRDGLNLTLKLPVTMPEAILGAKISIPTPHGDCLMTLPEGLHSGAKLRLKEMGVWRGSKKGDFYVIIEIRSPVKMNARLRELARELEAGYPDDPRKDISFK